MTSDDWAPRVGDWIEVLDGLGGRDEYTGFITQITFIRTRNGDTTYVFKHENSRVILTRHEFKILPRRIETDWSGWRELS